MRRAAKISLAFAIIYLVLGAFFLSTVQKGSLGAGWGGFVVGVAFLALAISMMVLGVIGLLLTALYNTHNKIATALGLTISVIIAVVSLLGLPGLVLYTAPYIIAGILAVR